MKSPFQVVRDFESALSEYTGAPYVVTTTSCTMALLLAVAWHLRNKEMIDDGRGTGVIEFRPPEIEIPKRTYVGVPMSIIHAGGKPTFRDEEWGERGYYQLNPLPVVDSARYFTSQLYRIAGWRAGQQAGHGSGMVCVSFHWKKTLGIQQGGAILHDSPEADRWLRKARFDGRSEGLHPNDDDWDVLGWHAYMSPEVAAEGLVRLANLPHYNPPLPPDDYPDLSTISLFR